MGENHNNDGAELARLRARIAELEDRDVLARLGKIEAQLARFMTFADLGAEVTGLEVEALFAKVEERLAAIEAGLQPGFFAKAA